MSDNVQLNAATGGPLVRTLGKAVNSAQTATPVGPQTQVFVLDVGGGLDASPETPLTVGQAVKALSLPVTLASDQGALSVSWQTPQPVAQTGTTGVDYSANRPTLPNIGAPFAGSGPYANYVLIATVPANLARCNLDIENTSGAQIAVVIDDGTAAGGAAPVNASVFSLTGGSGAGSQGGSWTSQTERGRVQIYAFESTAQVCVRAN